MKTTYVLKINKKYINRLLKYKIHIEKIKYHDDICFLYVDKDNYKEIIKYQDIYDISMIKVNGLLKYLELLKYNYIFIIGVITGLVFLFILSNTIFNVRIMTNNKELIKIIKSELEENNITKYHLVKSFKEKEAIKKKIIKNYQNKIEWIEIDRVGSVYYVKALERIVNDNKKTINYQNIIAKKNAMILEIKSSSGDIVKKVNDYVNKGDVIISGQIMKKDEIKNIVEAKGQVFGETWYNVKVELPRTYKVVKYTGNSFNKISLNIFDKRYFLFKNKNYISEQYQDSVIIKDKMLPFSINKTMVKETIEDTYFYTYQDALDIGLNLAKEKLLDSINKDSKILLQKKLKLYEENSKIIIVVFFKVYEDITDYQRIIPKDGE